MAESYGCDCSECEPETAAVADRFQFGVFLLFGQRSAALYNMWEFGMTVAGGVICHVRLYQSGLPDLFFKPVQSFLDAEFCIEGITKLLHNSPSEKTECLAEDFKKALPY